MDVGKRVEKMVGCADVYRYGFNGMERDQDGEWGSNTHYDYGFRIYNLTIAKFLSVDPLTKSYPMLTPYQFASNTPIQAIDLDGLEAFFIHGTNHGPDVWDAELVQTTKEELLALTNNNAATINDDFDWSINAERYEASRITGKTRKVKSRPLNHQTNNEADRTEAARLLANYVFQNMNGEEDITLIGYSHGGNVSIQAAKILREEFGVSEVNIITLNTTAFNNKGDVENPLVKNSGINDMVTLRTVTDNVAGGISPGSQDNTPANEGGDGTPRNRVFQIFPREEINGPFNSHYLENVDPEQIKSQNIEKLKPVDGKDY